MTTTTTQREADERALFEAWAKRHGHDVVSRLETGGKIYVSSFTRHAWAIWQARAALAQSEAPAPERTKAQFLAAERAGVSFSTQQKCWNAWFGVSTEPPAFSPVAAPEAPAITALRLQAAAANPDLVKVKPVTEPEAPASDRPQHWSKDT